jgi:hypothetical protein
MNFTVADIVFSSYAFLLFALLLVPSGYALGWALDLVDFRKQDAPTRLLLSVPLSIALLPILVYLLGRYSLGWPVWTVFGILAAAFLAIFRWRGLCVNPFAWKAAGGWAAISCLSLVDWQMGANQLYYSVTAYDYNFRSSVTAAFVRAHTLPPVNPFFSSGAPQPFRYHYFWFLLCSLPVRLSEAVIGHTGFTARHAVIASSMWAGLALFAVAALYLRFFFEVDPLLRHRVTVIAVLLFGVGGLDIIPALLGSFDGFYPTVDWWNSDQVTGWVDSLLWVPHAIGSLLACLVGFLILWNRPKFRWQNALAAGIAFASATGISIYVTLVFAVFAGVWTLRLALQRDWARVSAWSGAGAAAGLLALPFLRELAGKSGGQGSFLVIEFRHFQPATQLLDAMGLWAPRSSALANLLCLPLNYFLELGFFFAVGWWIFRRNRDASPAAVAARLMLTSTVAFCSVVRSNTIQMNDLGARGMLIAQFVLVLWGAIWLAEGGKRHWLVAATLAVGILTNLYELATMRAFTVLADRGIIAGVMEIDPDDDLGRRDFDARQVYEKLDILLPRTAVLQHHPSDKQDIIAGLYASRQFAIMDRSTAVTFTGDSEAPERVMAPLKQLFENERNDSATVCKELGIDALVATDVDPVWNDQKSWVWTMPLLAATDTVRGLDCRPAARNGRDRK